MLLDFHPKRRFSTVFVFGLSGHVLTLLALRLNTSGRTLIGVEM
jgi:hypothetical protein